MTMMMMITKPYNSLVQRLIHLKAERLNLLQQMITILLLIFSFAANNNNVVTGFRPTTTTTTNGRRQQKQRSCSANAFSSSSSSRQQQEQSKWHSSVSLPLKATATMEGDDGNNDDNDNTKRSKTITTASTTAIAEEDQAVSIGMPYDDNLLYMGISQELDELPKGKILQKSIDFDLVGEEQQKDTTRNPSRRTIEIEKLSQRPPLFLLRNVLTAKECQQIQKWAISTGEGMEIAETRMGGTDSGEYRQNSQMIWIPNTSRSGLQSLAKEIQSIFLPFEALKDGSLLPQAGGVEELQVVRYGKGGQYKLHHDGALRILTVLYYLNGVSSTHFPLADYTSAGEEGEPRRMRTRMEALEIAASNADGESGGSGGVTVSNNVNAGDAIAFYNYFQDGTFEWNSIHAGLPVASAEKWIATHWYHHVPPQKAAEALEMAEAEKSKSEQ